jgi:hypothetical protein
MPKARFVIPVIALGGLAIGSFVLLRRRRNQTASALARPDLWVALGGLADSLLHLREILGASS